MVQPSWLITNWKKAENWFCGLAAFYWIEIERKGNEKEQEIEWEANWKTQGRRDRVSVGNDLQLSWLSGSVTDGLGKVLIGGLVRILVWVHAAVHSEDLLNIDISEAPRVATVIANHFTFSCFTKARHTGATRGSISCKQAKKGVRNRAL